MKPLRYHPEALAELGGAPNYYLLKGLISNGDELQTDLLEALQALQTEPTLHPEVVQGLRAWRPTTKYLSRIARPYNK